MQTEVKKFIAFDIETTGLDFHQDAVIQISAARYVDGIEVDYFDTLVNSDYIPDEITKLTGITNDQVLNAPTLDEVMPYLFDYLGDTILVGHNIKSFDFPFLKAKGYNIAEGHEIYDTRYFAATRKHGAVNNQLTTLKLLFGIDAISHNALNDVRISAIVFMELLKIEPQKKSSTLKKSSLDSFELDDDTTPFFEGMSFVVTGAFDDSKYNRKQIETLIKQHGGRVSSSLSAKTDYFIQGIQISSQLKDGKHSSKELKYIELREKGVDIYKFNGNQFYELITNYRKLRKN